jgi:hypothetical protein
VIERVQVRVQGNTEMVDVTIHWAGTFVSQHQLVRPVAGYCQLRDIDRLVHRLGELRDLGLKAREIAARLNQEGFRPRRSKVLGVNNTMVYQLLSRWGLSGERNEEVELGPDEWWLSDLARKLGVCMTLLRRWACRGWDFQALATNEPSVRYLRLRCCRRLASRRARCPYADSRRAQVGRALEQRLEDETALQPGQRRSQATPGRVLPATADEKEPQHAEEVSPHEVAGGLFTGFFPCSLSGCSSPAPPEHG